MIMHQSHEKFRFILIGAGNMARSYIDVFNSQGIDFEVICRTSESALKLKRDKKDIKVINGGIRNYITKSKCLPNHAIVCVEVKNLKEIGILLIEKGIKNILIEKPGGFYIEEIKELSEYARKFSCNLFIAYNRRFYQSVNIAKKIIKDDGGIRTCFFEFTEWIHKLNEITEIQKQRLVLGNSTHLLDLFLHFCGKPYTLNCEYGDNLSWHKNCCIYGGSGKTSKGIIFSYISDWKSAGRWNLELTTPKRRIYFCPLEKLFCTDLGTLNKYEITPENDFDIKYKPGIYMMVKKFIENNFTNFCSIDDQLSNFETYYKIANY